MEQQTFFNNPDKMGGAPLALRMRPETLDEFVGQEDIIGKGRLLRTAIENDTLTSAIFYGPPGTGKTTLAHIIANTTKARFCQLNAVTSGVADIRKVIEEAKKQKQMFGKKTILFIDEIHRFNKSQQDALLPSVEDGTIVLIGATTENPFMEVIAPLVSRSRVFRLKPLADHHMAELINRALVSEKGLRPLNIMLDQDALGHIINTSNGDVRCALSTLEMAALYVRETEEDERRITLQMVEEAVQTRVLQYDKDGDNHYDTISAFIKSMRGSNPDAAVYWLAKMIAAGEDPKFIARRIIIQAAEDVGNADPHALLVAVAAARAVEFVGLPEAQIPLAQAAIYLACAPKSNASCEAIAAAMKDVKHGTVADVPLHLKSTAYKGTVRLGHGKGYKYPHDYPGNYVPQSYLPPHLQNKRYYVPTENGYEKTISQRLKVWRQEK
jgi:putative ATPase